MTHLIAKDGQLATAIAAELNIDATMIEGLGLIVDTPAGTIVMHTSCCEPHFFQNVAELANAPSREITSGSN